MVFISVFFHCIKPWTRNIHGIKNCSTKRNKKIGGESLMTIDVDIIFKIAAIGIIVAVLNQVLIRAGREDQAMMTTLAGIIVVLVIIIQMINDFFIAVKTMFQF